MKKNGIIIIIFVVLSTVVSAIILFSKFLSSHEATSAITADFSAVIDISTQSPKEIPLGMSGPHNELGGSVYRWDNPELIDRVNQYDGFGYVRINGTNLNAYDWKTGSYGVEALGQLQSDDKSFYGYTESGRVIETKGGETLKDLREFLQRTSSRVIIPVNVFTSSVEQIGDMAKYCYENHIPVIYFELGNEVSFYTAEAKYNRSHRFKTGTDYLNRMVAYNKAIKDNYPGAKTVVAMDNLRKDPFDNDFKMKPFWDAITFHRFVGDGPNLDAAMMNANNGVKEWDEFIFHYLYASNNNSMRIEIGEHSTSLEGILSLTHYNGIIVAENMLRFSKHPNIDYFQSWRIPLGIGYPTNDYRDRMLDAYQRNSTIDPNSLTYNFYDKAPSVSARVVDGALNKSTAVWKTIVTGGAEVKTQKNSAAFIETMPALYAQAFRGINGKNYVVIVNKSDKTHGVSVKLDNNAVNKAMSMTYVSAAPGSRNNENAKPVFLQTAAVKSGKPALIPAYSVTRLEWTRSAELDIPIVPWLSHADAGYGKVDLKWHASENAKGYKVKYGTDPNNMIKEIDAGNVTSYTVPDLTDGAAYYFAVAAYNKAGISPYSNQDKSNVVYVKVAAPAAPKVTNYHYEMSGRAVIEWQSVPDAAGYKLKYGTSPGSYSNVIDVGNNVGKIVEGLTNGKPYFFSISSYNGVGESSDSEEVSVTPSADVPLAPHDLEIVKENGTSITIGWKNTRTQRETANFENGSPNWINVSGAWSVVNHPNSARESKVYKSPANDTAISVFENAGSGDMEGEANIYVNGPYGYGSQAGIVVRYTDKDNYYMFVFNNKTNKFQLIKRYQGNNTILAEIDRKNSQNPADMIMRLEVNRNKLIARLNGDNIFDKTIIDSNKPLTDGIFGLISISQEVYFDDIILRKEIGTVNVYRSEDAHSNFTKAAGGITGTEWSESELDAGKSYYYRVTAEYNGNESYDHSNTVLMD